MKLFLQTGNNAIITALWDEEGDEDGDDGDGDGGWDIYIYIYCCLKNYNQF